jgi:hypothetical protein
VADEHLQSPLGAMERVPFGHRRQASAGPLTCRTVIARLALISSIALSAAACGGSNPAAPIKTTGSSGLEGKVTISPGTNTCKAGSSCMKPAKGFTLEFSQYGHQVARTKTGSDGSYRVTLSAKGRYVIGVKGGPGVAPTVKPPTATVEQGQFKHLDIQLDVGIR